MTQTRWLSTLTRRRPPRSTVLLAHTQRSPDGRTAFHLDHHLDTEHSKSRLSGCWSEMVDNQLLSEQISWMSLRRKGNTSRASLQPVLNRPVTLTSGPALIKRMRCLLFPGIHRETFSVQRILLLSPTLIQSGGRGLVCRGGCTELRMRRTRKSRLSLSRLGGPSSRQGAWSRSNSYPTVVEGFRLPDPPPGNYTAYPSPYGQ